jgi:MFS transporter, DHA3 family, tetracycline resistance protein
VQSLRHRDPASVYLFMRGAFSLGFALMGSINLVYQVEVAHLDPLGLLLVGSVLELTCLLFQVPTGLLADTYSRKLAVVAGVAMVGAGFLLEGLVPNFWSILVAQVIWGGGASLSDGADDAWITEEVGTERSARLFLRSSQIGQVAALAGVLIALALATVRLNLPIVVGALLTLVLSGLLPFLMREEKFVPAPRHPEGALAGMGAKGRATIGEIRAKPVLLSVLLVTALAGASSEGLDRLFQVHLLKDVGLPQVAGVSPLYGFAVAMIGSVLVGFPVIAWARRRIDLQKHSVAVRALFISTTVLSASVIAFGLAPSFPAAVVAYWVARNAARVWDPVQRAWLNQSLEPSTRATLFSVDGQANALGQIASGPILGLIARASIPAALVISGALLLPALAVFYRESRRAPIPASPPPGGRREPETRPASPALRPSSGSAADPAARRAGGPGE